MQPIMVGFIIQLRNLTDSLSTWREGVVRLMRLKILSITIAAMFIFGAFIVAYDTDDSEAITAGKMNIYVYNGTAWTDYTNLSGYNALQALQASAASFTAASHYESSTQTSFLSTDYIIQKSNAWGTYDEINSNYGDLLTVNGVTEADTNVWNTYYYNNGWNVGIAAIGFIVPFTDGAIASANVVLYYGPSTTDVPTAVTEYMAEKTLRTMITPSGSNYRFEFDLSVTQSYTATVAGSPVVEYYNKTDGVWSTKTLTSGDLTEGIKIRGYGSNAYIALKSAVGSANLSAVETPGPYYGWFLTFFGLTTQQVGTTYHYWEQNTSSGTYLAFNLGAFSTLSNVPTDVTTGSTTNYNFVVSGFSISYV